MSDRKMVYIVLRDGWIFERQFDTVNEAADYVRTLQGRYRGTWSYRAVPAKTFHRGLKKYVRALKQ